MTEKRHKTEDSYMAGTELRIEETTGSRSTTVRLEGVSFATAPPRVGEKIELKEGKFNVIEVSHVYTGSPVKHLIVVTVESPQPTIAQ